MNNLSILARTLRDISAKAKTFGKCGALMSEATRRLSMSCKLQSPNDDGSADLEGPDGEVSKSAERERALRMQRKVSLGEEMTGVLAILGQILDEVADAQVQMCESLEASLSLSLELFAQSELEEATRLKSEAETYTEQAESSYAKYLHGKQNNSTGATVVSQNSPTASKSFDLGIDGSNVVSGGVNWNKISENMGSQFKTFLRNGGSSSAADTIGGSSVGSVGGSTSEGGGSGNATLTSSSDNTNPSSPSKLSRRSKSDRNLGDKNNSKEPCGIERAIAAATLRQNLEEIRLAQANGELKRFQLLKQLENFKTRRNFELGESALASLNGIKTFFRHCGDLTQGLTPRLQSIQKQQTEARRSHESQQVPWESRERGLLGAINDVSIAANNASVIANAIERGQTTGLGASVIADQPTSLEAIEEEVGLWDLVQNLAEHALFVRDPKPGIEIEGWLYKKASSRMAMSTWSKRWFLLDKTGIYYLKGGSLSENGRSSNGSLERVKVCDTVLCTVREVNESRIATKGNSGIRFCFELLSPNNRPYMLQSCGPKEFKMWVAGIRACLERQLVHGNVPSDDMLLKPGTSKTLRRVRRHFPGVNGDGGSNMSKVGDKSEEVEDGGVYSESSVEATSSTPKNPLLKKILSMNKTCVDCGTKSPEWVSVNLGVLVCIECGGVHRSLGVHLSKVRSLRLDQLSDAECRLIVSLGNEFNNSIWEGGINAQKGWKKPKSESNRKVKEEWIKSKYMWRGFIDYKPADGRDQQERESKFNNDLYKAASKCDLHSVAEALAKGAVVTWQNGAENGKTALHICVVHRKDEKKDWKGLETAELLIQNGAKIDTKDVSSQSVIDTAIVGNAEREMIEYLMARIKN